MMPWIYLYDVSKEKNGPFSEVEVIMLSSQNFNIVQQPLTMINVEGVVLEY